MTEQAKKYLIDILHAIELIESFVSHLDHFEEYCCDARTKSAVERQLGIVGEAVNKFNKHGTGFELTNSDKIVSVRNRLIHSYDAIDDTIVWAILHRHLPILKEEAQFGLLR